MAHDHNDIDKVSGVHTTGHEWDGIKELNNPLPRWWLYLFYICIVWAVGYWVFYPAWPLANGYTAGILQHSNRLDALNDAAAGKAAQAAKGAALANATPADIAKSPDMMEYAEAEGKAVFREKCAPCHGVAGTGSKGFPNLTDDDWLWGGKYDDILKTITVGIRGTDPNTRDTQMPAFGKDGILKEKQIIDVAAFVRSLSGEPAELGGDVAAGKQLFADNCAACHGDQGKGNPELGAPNLSDKIWLYGGDTKTIIETITYARRGVMPTWGGKLDASTIKSLAVYVHNLGGGM